MSEATNFSCGKFTLGLFFIILYIFNVVSDIAVTICYYSKGYMMYFGLTFIFVLGPAVITNLGTMAKLQQDTLFPDSRFCQILLWIFRFFSLGRLWMLIEFQIHNWNSTCFKPTHSEKKAKDGGKKQKPDINTVRKEFKETIKQMRLWETLTESTPQLYLQLYIMTKSVLVLRSHGILELHPEIQQNNHNLSSNGSLHQPFLQEQFPPEVYYYQICSIITSFASIAASLASYMYSYQRDNFQKHIPLQFFVCFFLWQLCWIVTNIFSLTLFASAFSYWFFIPITNRIALQRLFEYNVLKRKLFEFSTISFFDTGFLTIKFYADSVKKKAESSESSDSCNGNVAVANGQLRVTMVEEQKCSESSDSCNGNVAVANGQLNHVTVVEEQKCSTSNQEVTPFSPTFVLSCFVYCALESSCLVAMWCWIVDKSTWFYWQYVGFHVSVLVLQFICLCICLCRYDQKLYKCCNKWLSRLRLSGNQSGNSNCISRISSWKSSISRRFKSRLLNDPYVTASRTWSKSSIGDRDEIVSQEYDEYNCARNSDHD